MGAALAVRRRDEAVHDTQPAPRVRVLGPSEGYGSALQRLLAKRQGDVSLPKRRELVSALVQEELRAIGSFGVVEVPHFLEAVEQGHKAKAIEHLVTAGFGAHHAREIVELAVSQLAPHLLEEAMVSTAIEVAAPVLGAAKLFYDALRLIGSSLRDAHDAGRSDAMLVNYAQTFARTIVDAFYGEGVARPEHTGLSELDSARAEAFAQAMALLRKFDAQTATETATALKQELGTATNARNAIIETILAQHGKQGIVLHQGGAVR